MSFFKKLFSFQKEPPKIDLVIDQTKKSFWSKIMGFISNHQNLTPETLAELEEILIQADIGIATTEKIIKILQEKVEAAKNLKSNQLTEILTEIILDILKESSSNSTQNESFTKPEVILVVGVNGVGKTTTIAKLANLYKNNGLKVLVGAADTFRAAAPEQLQRWMSKLNIEVVSQGLGADPSAVAFDTINKALSKEFDIVIIDTAGRLHNKIHLMEELSKIKRVIQKKIPNAPHEILLVIDGSTGQNALIQAQEFSKVTPITHIAVTKLDGTAKGGVLIAIADQLKIPVKYIGAGEKIDDLMYFDAEKFIHSLLSKPTL
ncbi:MAG: signal recognition particle-docking protein FtsY [Alphaproteobacteria bacterium]|nr:signal recognition particle-docking protein FtsY [Alphaproteobacteria bacterium]